VRENGSKKDSGSVGVSSMDPFGRSESVVITAGRIPAGRPGPITATVGAKLSWPSICGIVIPTRISVPSVPSKI